MSKQVPRGPLLKSNGASSSAQAMLQEAIALHQQGQLDAAQIQYEAVLRKQPRNADALHLLGLIALQLKNHQRAADLIAKAIKASPGNAAYYVNQGIALKELGQLAAAVASYDRAIALQPGYAAAYYSRGNALKDMKKFEAAVDSFDRALALQPGDPLAQLSRGAALLSLQKLDAAIASFDHLIASQTHNADAHFNRGLALDTAGRNSEAIASYDQAIALNPNYAEAHYNRGISLRDQNRLNDAIACFDRAVAIKPSYFQAVMAWADVLKMLGQLDAAIVQYDRAIALQPDHVDPHWNKALALLLGGHFARGWELYEWRWKRDEKVSRNEFFQEPRWTGKQTLEGKSVYLHHEQGFGDTLQFCRYAKLAADRGARVIMEVPQALMGVLQTLEGVSEWVAAGAARPAFEYHCPMLSLPMVFETTLASIPSTTAYLHADENLVAQWAQTLGPKTAKRVGLVWSGSTIHKNDHNRSIALESLLAAMPADVELVSLQKEIRETDQAVLLNRPHVRHFGDALRDFTDTAALCSLMDVVVSVDTSVAHLSAALGRPTWVLLPFSPDWRWLLNRDDSPWYASVKLYRQTAPGDWTPVFAALHEDLKNLPPTD